MTKQGKPVKAVKAWAFARNGKLEPLTYNTRPTPAKGDKEMGYTVHRVLIRPAPKRVVFDELAGDSLSTALRRAEAAARGAWEDGQTVRITVVVE